MVRSDFSGSTSLATTDFDAVEPDKRIASDSLPGAGDEEDFFLDLASADWNFRGAETNRVTHSFHPYPARFIPQIPAKLIQALTQPGEVVYDPFVGCGTSCVEANIAGRNALGNDVNELAVLISNTKVNSLPEGAEDEILETTVRACARAQSSIGNYNLCNTPESSRNWFEDFVAHEVSIIMDEIGKLTHSASRDFCHVALSAILVSISRQDSDTRYVRVPKNLSKLDSVQRYKRKIIKMLQLAHESSAALSRGVADIRFGDSREVGIFPDNTADLIVTSPPYPNAYDYHLYHRHRLLWLGMDPKELKRQEIGAHAHYSRKNGLDENDFRQDMQLVFLATRRVLKRGRYFAIVVGDSILNGRQIRNKEIIKEAAGVAGFRTATEFRRRIDSRKKSFNPSHGNVNWEDIVVLKNERLP